MGKKKENIIYELFIVVIFLLLFSLVISFCSENYEDIFSLLKFPNDININDEFIIF